MSALLDAALLLPLLAPALQADPPPPARGADVHEDLPERAVQRLGSQRLLHATTVYTLAFARDGSWFATGAEDGWVRVFDGKTGDGVRQLDATGHGAILQISLAPDGRRIAAGTRGRVLKIFDATTGEAGPEWPDVGFASAWIDADRIALVDGTKLVRVLDAKSGEQVAELDTSPQSMEDIVASPCGRWIAARGRHREKLLSRAGAHGDTSAVVVIDARTLENVATIGFPDGTVTDAVFSPDGERLYLSDDLGRIDVFDTAARKEVDVLAGDGLAIYALALDPVGGQLLLARAGGVVERVTLEPLERRGGWVFSGGSMYSRLACRPTDGAVLGAAGQHVELRTSSGEPLVAPLRHLSVVTTLSFSADGERLLSAAHDGAAMAWNTVTGRPIGATLKHANWVFDAALWRDGTRAATATRDGSIYFWTLGADAPAIRAETGEFAVLSVDVSSDGRHVLAATADGSVLLCLAPAVGSGADAGALEVVSRLDRVGGAYPLARFLGGGDRVVVAGRDLRIHSLPNFEEVRSLGDVGSVHSLTTSDDGRYVGVGLFDGTVRVLETATGRRRAPMTGFGTRVHSLSFDPDGRYIAAVHEHDDVVRVWSTADGREVARWSGQGTPLTAVRFAPDGRRIATGGFDGSILIWRFEP